VAAPSRRALTGLVVLIVLVVVSSMLSLAIGSRWIDPSTVLGVLVDPDGTDESVIVHELRIPRTIVGVLV